MSSDPDAFPFRDGTLHAGDAPLPELAAAYGTPLYVYDAATIRRRVFDLRKVFAESLPDDHQPMIAYACKANTNGAILRLMAGLRLGADVVSGGEMIRAIEAGIPADKIVFSGVGKTDDELAAAIASEIMQINIESASELDRLIMLNPPCPVRVAFRLNPDVDAGTHAKIATGHGSSKFGMPAEEIIQLHARAKAQKNIIPVGLSVHIGSQITDIEPFEEAFRKTGALARALEAETIDFGGGLGVAYHDGAPEPDLAAYGRAVATHLAPACRRLVTEPGRFLVAQSGILLARVLHVKTTPGTPILILDAGMNDLVRPAMYDATHRIIPVTQRQTPETQYDIVGPVCESSDVFARGISMPQCRAGDLVAIMDCGAYGFTMAGPYNSRPMPAEVIVDGARHGLARKRQTLRAMIADECLPDWMVA